MDQKEFSNKLENKKCVSTNGKSAIVTGTLQGLLYTIHEQPQATSFSVGKIASYRIGHERITHMEGMETVDMFRKGVVRMYHEFMKVRTYTFKCPTCVLGKAN